MTEYPTIIEHLGETYDINYQWHIALECIALMEDDTVSDQERTIGVCTLLFGEDIPIDEFVIQKAVKFLQCGIDTKEQQNRVEDMDLVHDRNVIEVSFRSDYGIDLDIERDMHFWKYIKHIEGLRNESLLSTYRQIRNAKREDFKDDPKQWANIQKTQKQIAIPNKQVDKKKNLDELWKELMKKQEEDRKGE